ncbi:membrane protein [Siminovitchia terrae]|uniref:Membrane protein n=1 Tax=Siminovitchia terrae TaxID=1914933 RepID=A0ABQ4L3H4_SIMTE|nr:membrane protein [Siminovitchia terrae]
MGIELTALHWIYLLFIGFTILMMIFRRDITIICIAGVFLLGLTATGSIAASISGIFSSFMYAISELLSIILVISIITSMSRVLMATGINDLMISPFAKIIKTPTLAFWTIGIVMMIISWFFWPSPAVALMGAVLLPVALRVGLPALGAAMAMNLFGHGIALSGDFIIQAAPKLSGDAAGITASDVITASIPLIIIMGIVTTVTAFVLLKRDMKKGKLDSLKKFSAEEILKKNEESELPLPVKRIFAAIIPLLFVANIIMMFTLKLQGGEATALIGGTSVLILIFTSIAAHKQQALEKTTKFLIEGLQFGFRVFGPVIPIAAFFYLGGGGFEQMIGSPLPEGSEGIINDLGTALAAVVPITKSLGAFTIAAVGVITGLDGSGFSGLPLTGSIAALFGKAIGSGTASLTALGQITTIWIGGGTLIPWALNTCGCHLQCRSF